MTLEVRFLKIYFCILVGLKCAKFHWASSNGPESTGGGGGGGGEDPLLDLYLVVFLLVNTLYVFIIPHHPLKGCTTCKSFEDF